MKAPVTFATLTLLGSTEHVQELASKEDSGYIGQEQGLPAHGAEFEAPAHIRGDGVAIVTRPRSELPFRGATDQVWMPELERRRADEAINAQMASLAKGGPLVLTLTPY